MSSNSFKDNIGWIQVFLISLSKAWIHVFFLPFQLLSNSEAEWAL